MIENWFLRFCYNAYSFIIKIGTNLQSIFLLYMRLTWGHLIFLIGLHKYQQMDQTVQFFRDLNFLHPSFHAHLTAVFEIFGGIMLVIGLGSRLVAIPLIIIMITALSTAHAQDLNSFRFLLEPSVLALSAPYPYLMTAVLMFVFGPGKISIDGWIKKTLHHHK